jgi:hypothetical protein
MYDDGLHNDGTSSDGIYGTEIPPVINEFIYYHFQAVDNTSHTARFPDCVDFKFKIGFEPPAVFINEFMASNDDYRYR